MSGTIIAVAPTGAAGRKADVPALPVTLDELVSTAKECEALGAAVIHVHVRDAAGVPTLDPARLRDTVAALQASTDLIVQLATDVGQGGINRVNGVSGPAGISEHGGASGADRLAVLDAGPEMATCAAGLGDVRSLHREGFAVDLHLRMQERGIVPVYEIADPDHLALLERLLDEHGLPFGGHVHVDLVMGAPDGMPGTTAALVAAERMLRDLPAGTTFAATGIGPSTLPVMLAALSAGGHLRVGMADTLWYAQGRPVESNMQLVARAVGLAQLAQRPPVTPREARQLLGVPLS